MFLKLLSILIFHTFSILFFLNSCQSNNESHVPTKIVRTRNYSVSCPTKIKFFNQQIDLSDFDLRERLDRELLVNQYFQSSTCLAIKRSMRYFPEIEQILSQAGVPSDFKYLCVAESNLAQVQSSAGASGFWQFMPQTAKEYDLRINDEIDERMHIEKSTRAACRLIKKNYAVFKDWINACASYNRGPGGLQNDLQEQEVEHFFDAEMNSETARYVFRIMAIKLILENPKQYGFDIAPKDCYSTIKTKSLRISKPIENLVTWAKNHGSSYKLVKLLNPWILSKKLSKKSIPCIIKLPVTSNQLRPIQSKK